MAATKTETASAETPVEIFKLKSMKKTPESVFRGICAAEGWRPGKSVTESDYDAAAKKFLGKPVGKAGS